MGVKDLWHVLTPYAERKPISEMRGKVVAIDLAGWVCESLNVVDYFVHPRHHLKNLFFRTCYLIWEDVTPVFILEGEAPKLKSGVIAKRNELQFRGVKPKKTNANDETECAKKSKKNNEKGRTRFNHVLKQCENLLKAMGIECLQGPGEAEAYCAYLNKKGLVDAVISQDSDCFAYGAVCVYRNFSVSTQGAQAAQGGAVDIYNMNDIRKKIDLGQNKVIAMALLCGCDYCPEGVGGVGRDGVLKLFNKYADPEILDRIRSWRRESDKYNALEMRVDDKNICANCGHLGRTASHTKNGCGICRSKHGCDDSLWKEQRLAIKAELMLRKKALVDPSFPCEEIIDEFLSEPVLGLTKLNLTWKQPNIVKFIKQIGQLLQWSEIYCFQKFLPILTRWQLCNANGPRSIGGIVEKSIVHIVPKEIVKKRTVKGCPSLEVIWNDQCGFFNGLVPDEQIQEFAAEHAKGIDNLWTTIEPLILFEGAYPDMVAIFLKSKEKAKKPASRRKHKGGVENMQDLLNVTGEIAATLQPKSRENNKKPRAKKKRKPGDSGLQTIDKFMKQTGLGKASSEAVASSNPKLHRTQGLALRAALQCSTPTLSNRVAIPSDLDSDLESSAPDMDLSAVVNDIVRNTKRIGDFVGQMADLELLYDSLTKQEEQLSLVETQVKEAVALDETDLALVNKRNRSFSERSLTGSPCHQHTAKHALGKQQLSKVQRMSMDDSFDVMVSAGTRRIDALLSRATTSVGQNVKVTPVERFKSEFGIATKDCHGPDSFRMDTEHNVSFFHCSNQEIGVDGLEKDAFEVLMEETLGHSSKLHHDAHNANDGAGDNGNDDADGFCISLSSDSSTN